MIKKILQKHELMKKKSLQNLHIQKNILNALQKINKNFLVNTFENMF